MSRDGVLEVITGAELGGAQRVLLYRVKERVSRGENVQVAFGKGDYLASELTKLSTPYFRFKHLRRSLNPISAMLFVFEFWRFLRTRNDIYKVSFHSSNSLFGAISAKLLKRRTIFTFHGMSFLDRGHRGFLRRSFYYFLYRFLLIFINETIFVCKANLEYAKKLGLSKDGVVVQNQIEKIPFLSRNEARKELLEKFGIHFGNPSIVSIGRFAYPKNYEFLISNLALVREKFPSLSCVLVGDGPERDKYERLSKKHGLLGVLQMPGEIADFSKYLRAFDLFVLPSLYEGCSIALLESKQAGLACLASGVGGNSEILSDKEIFDLENLDSFLSKFYELIKSYKGED